MMKPANTLLTQVSQKLTEEAPMSRIVRSHQANFTCDWRVAIHCLSFAPYLLAVCLLGSSGVAQTQASQWKAGVARAVITPEKGVWLAGYGSKRPPDGKLHDLWMKALAIPAPSISPIRSPSAWGPTYP